MKLAIALVFALLFAPLGGHATQRADSNAEFVAKLVAAMEEMANIVDSNKNDCNAMGDKLDKFLTDNAAFFRDAKERAAKLTDQEKKDMEQRYNARLQVVIVKLQEGLTKCASNPKVVSAIQKAPR